MRASRLFLILWLGVISGSTLVPVGGVEQVPSFFCVLCGHGAVADILLNVALFLPLGLALSADGWRPLRALTLGAAFSLAIEIAQFAIPGRDPSLSDVLSNTLGTALGIGLVRSARVWWRPGPRLANALAIAAAVAAAGVLVSTGALFAPSFPEDTYYAGWTPRFGHLAWYGGRVQEVALDDFPLPEGRIAASAQVRQHLALPYVLVVRARAGPHPAGLAPLFTINDRHTREIVLVGVRGDDLVYRYRTRAVAWGLRAPAIRVRGALRDVAAQSPLLITVRRTSSTYCLTVNTAERCGLGHTPGGAWALVLGGQPIPIWLQPALPIVWLAALFVPIGLWARLDLASALAIALPLATAILLAPPVETLGAVAGLVAGGLSAHARLKSGAP